MKTKRTFTDEQIKALAPYEQNFRTAVYSNYSRRVGGPDAAYAIGRIYHDATGIQLAVYPSCQDCMMRLLKQVGKAYLEDLELIENEKVEEAARQVVNEAEADNHRVVVSGEEIDAAAQAKPARRGRVRTTKQA